MKNNRLNGMILRIATLAFAVSLVAPMAARADAPSSLTKKQVQSLIKTASTPADHLKIAGYFRTQAARFRASAAEHQKMIADNQTFSPTKAWSARGVNHCEYMVKIYIEQAAKAEAQAAEHEQMAAQSNTALSR